MQKLTKRQWLDGVDYHLHRKYGLRAYNIYPATLDTYYAKENNPLKAAARMGREFELERSKNVGT